MGTQKFFRFMLITLGLVLLAFTLARNSFPNRPNDDMTFSALQAALAEKSVTKVTITGQNAAVEKKNDKTIYNVQLPERWESIGNFTNLLYPTVTNPKDYRPEVIQKTPAMSGPLFNIFIGLLLPVILLGVFSQSG